MFNIIDFSSVLLAVLLGLALGIGIVLFLFYAAIRSASLEQDMSEETQRRRLYTSMNQVYETRRAHLHAIVRDPEVVDW